MYLPTFLPARTSAEARPYWHPERAMLAPLCVKPDPATQGRPRETCLLCRYRYRSLYLPT